MILNISVNFFIFALSSAAGATTRWSMRDVLEEDDERRETTQSSTINSG